MSADQVGTLLMTLAALALLWLTRRRRGKAW